LKKASARVGAPDGGHATLRSALEVVEIAAALVLLTVSGRLLRSFEKRHDLNLGFQADHRLAALYILQHDEYVTQPASDLWCGPIANPARVARRGRWQHFLLSILPATAAERIAFTIEGYICAQRALG
jgi:hypothetical protein